jgi:hypothetical protein
LKYRKKGGERRSPLPDFYIGSHAAVVGMTLLTRDPARYRSYFPNLDLIAPINRYLSLFMVWGHCMPRISRAIAVGYPHHITQRGNYRQTVFAEAADYTHYLECIARYAPQCELEIWAYCLMPNHVHLICVPPAARFAFPNVPYRPYAVFPVF